MRIALVITELDPGGAENCLTQLACYLADRGHEVRVFAIGPPPAADQSKLLQQLDSHRIPVAICIPPSGIRSFRSFPNVARWLRGELKQFAPQIVQAMLFHGNLVSAMAIDSADLRARRVKFFGGVRVRQPERWRWWLQRWAARKMQKLVCVSDDVAEHCFRNERIPAAKVMTIANGVDVEALRNVAHSRTIEATLRLSATDRVLLFVGRLHPQKGVEELVDQADQLLESSPQHHLVLVGSGPLERRLRELAATKRSAARIHLVGWQPQAIAWMRRAEMLLLPAVYEGMPNVILEAMAVGLPVVAFDIDGIRQLLGQSDCAHEQIAAPGDFAQFNERVRKLIASAELRQRCAEYNSNRIEQKFQLNDQLGKYEAEYLGGND